MRLSISRRISHCFWSRIRSRRSCLKSTISFSRLISACFLSFSAWRFWLIMMIGACNDAKQESRRFKRIKGNGSKGSFFRMMMLRAIHTIKKTTNSMINGQEPPKFATRSAILCPIVQCSSWVMNFFLSKMKPCS